MCPKNECHSGRSREGSKILGVPRQRVLGVGSGLGRLTVMCPEPAMTKTGRDRHRLVSSCGGSNHRPGVNPSPS